MDNSCVVCNVDLVDGFAIESFVSKIDLDKYLYFKNNFDHESIELKHEIRKKTHFPGTCNGTKRREVAFNSQKKGKANLISLQFYEIIEISFFP